MTINDKNIVTSPPREIDPNWTLPPNIIGVRHTNIDEIDTAVSENNDGDTVVVEYDTEQIAFDETTPANFPSETFGPPPPDTFTVISQTVRIAADGKFVVDVVVDTEDVPGVSSYDMRVTKI